MPLYSYERIDSDAAGCGHCRDGFEVLQPISAQPLTHCPACGAPVRRCLPHINIGRSVSGLDDRAKEAGFTKLKRLGKGEYEKVY